MRFSKSRRFHNKIQMLGRTISLHIRTVKLWESNPKYILQKHPLTKMKNLFLPQWQTTLKMSFTRTRMWQMHDVRYRNYGSLKTMSPYKIILLHLSSEACRLAHCQNICTNRTWRGKKIWLDHSVWDLRKLLWDFRKTEKFMGQKKPQKTDSAKIWRHFDFTHVGIILRGKNMLVSGSCSSISNGNNVENDFNQIVGNFL